MSSAPRAPGGVPSGGEPDRIQRLRSMFDAYNELARTQGDILTWEREWFDPRAEYRPIEDRDWIRDPEAITRSIGRWMETWGPTTHRITAQEIREFGKERFLVTARNFGVGRRSGVPIEATTYMAMRWRAGKVVWFDEYLDEDAALAALARQGPAVLGAEREARATSADRAWQLGDAAFAKLVRRMSDRRLERLFGSDRALYGSFKRMERLFDPAKARGFTGEIQFELLGSEGQKKWIVRIDGGRATTGPGEAGSPVTTLRMRVPLFIRIAAREVHPVKAYREGLLEVSGDFDVATRMNAMFGGSAK